MPIPNHIEIRYVMLNHFKKNWTSGESYRDLVDTYGEDSISISTVKYWFSRFRSGDTNVEDKERDGRPSELDDDALLEAVEADESWTTRMLAEEFGVDHSTIVRHLQKLGKVWKRCGWVPHELIQQNKDKRVTTFTALLERHEQRPFLHHLITGDEKWILFRNFKRKKVCVYPGCVDPLIFHSTYTDGILSVSVDEIAI